MAVYTYDDLGNMTSEKYLDTAAMGVVPEGSKYAYCLMDYDDEGRLLSEEYADELGHPAPSRGGYASHFISYTESGLVAEEYFLDTLGKPMAVDGFSRRTLLSEDSDERTYVMRVQDETLDGDAYIETRQTFDRYDRPIRVSWFDAAGNPVAGPAGPSAVSYEYPGRGQVSLENWYDAAGNAAAVNGAYGVSRAYTAFGRLESETWLDESGNAAATPDGWATIRYSYDLSNSSHVEKYFQTYLDVNGERCAAANGAWGKTVLYYPTARVHEVTFTDASGAPVLTADGYAILEYEEDEYGNRTWEGYYDQYHGQAECADGYSSKESTYDGAGRLIAERYLDRYNKLTNNAEGVAGWNGYYDADGTLVITNRYDQYLKALPLEGQ